jgi:hypothetical protein
VDNFRVYRTIRNKMKQLCPNEENGNLARRLTILAAMIVIGSTRL